MPILLPACPKQVLWDILDTLDVCNNSDEPFDFLKNTLLGQFGKSKWQSYCELLRLPMEMQGLKPSVLMGKLNNISLQEYHLTMTCFLQCFRFIFHYLWKKQQELAPIKRPQPWWRLRTRYGMLGVATTLRSQPPQHSEAGALLPASGREATKGAVTPARKVAPLPAQMYCECGQGKNHLATTPEGLVGPDGLSIFILSCREPWNTVFILCRSIFSFRSVPTERFNSSSVPAKVRL
jgi:hypothetical protein